MNNIIQITAAASDEGGDTLFALSSTGEIYERTSKFFRYKVNEKNEPDPNGERTKSKSFPYWEKVQLNNAPIIPFDMLAAKWEPEK